MGDEPVSATAGELFKQMAAIHAQIALLRYRTDLQSLHNRTGSIECGIGAARQVAVRVGSATGKEKGPGRCCRIKGKRRGRFVAELASAVSRLLAI
jgi:hypothetical protein